MSLLMINNDDCHDGLLQNELKATISIKDVKVTWHINSSLVYRFGATGQVLHSAVGSNQAGCSCAWQISLSRETNTAATKEIPALNQSWRACNYPTSNWPYQFHILSRGPPTACHHCGQTLNIDHLLLECAVLQECRDEYYAADPLKTHFETIPETCIVEFLREAGFFYLIRMVRHSIQFITWITPDLIEFVKFN